jgi:hypothetical protein
MCMKFLMEGLHVIAVIMCEICEKVCLIRSHRLISRFSRFIKYANKKIVRRRKINARRTEHF